MSGPAAPDDPWKRRRRRPWILTAAAVAASAGLVLTAWMVDRQSASPRRTPRVRDRPVADLVVPEPLSDQERSGTGPRFGSQEAVRLEQGAWVQVADANGNLGPIYGYQWRSWPAPNGEHIDQIAQLIQQIKANPDSRRLIVSAWNVSDIPRMKLPPCHAFFQFYVADGKLSCQLYQRSADIFLGVPFNIASYALLTHMVAEQTGLNVGDFIWTGGDCHIYVNHFEQVNEQLSRQPLPLPKVVLKRKPASIFDYRYEDIEVVGYQSHPAIKAPVAV